MITVVVLINGQPIFTRSARNLGIVDESHPNWCKYKTDSGQIVIHERKEGFVPLAKMMLDTIDESNITNKEES
jgi:hypothetical protein